MKIHFVIWSLELGGAQSSLMRLTDELAQDHEVIMTALSGSGAEFFQPSPKVTYRSLGPNLAGRSTPIRVGSLIVRWFRLVRALREPTDVVVSFLYSTTLVAAPACALARRPLVAAERTDLEHRRVRARRLVLWAYRRRCAAVVVQTNTLASWLSSRVAPVPVAVIANPFPVLATEAVAIRHGVVALGRYDAVKGFDLLIEAAARMRSGRPVDIYGAGREGHRLRMLIEQLGVADRVRLHPPTDNPGAVLAGAEVLAVPSLLDGFPNVILEALALKTPVVATRTTGATAIDGGTGAVQLVDHNAQDLASALDTLCEDQGRVADQVARATDRSTVFDRRTIARQWSDLLEKTTAL